MGAIQKKLLETLNEISIYISQHFEISTEQQLIFLKILSITPHRKHFHFCEMPYLFSKHFLSFDHSVFSALILYHRNTCQCSVPDFSR
jgi:hypothetical protein